MRMGMGMGMLHDVFSFLDQSQNLTYHSFDSTRCFLTILCTIQTHTHTHTLTLTLTLTHSYLKVVP
jgi:hypothetical protein